MIDRHTRVLGALAAAADAFRRSGDQASEARTRLDLGMRLRSLERWEDCLPHYARAAELFAQLNDDWGQALAHFHLAQVLCMRGRLEESLPHYARAVELVEALGVDELWADAEESWLHALLELQRWDEVISHCARIVAFTEQRRVPELRELEMKAHFHWAHALTVRGDYPAALPHAQHVASWATETGDGMIEAHMRLIMAIALRDTERFDEALQEYERLLALRHHLDEPELMMHVLSGMGTILEKSPRTGAARFDELAQQHHASGDTYLEGLCRYWQGSCLERVRPLDYQASIEQYRLAGQLLDSCGAEREAGDAYYRAATALNYFSLDVTQHVSPHWPKQLTVEQREAFQAELKQRLARYRDESLDLYTLAAARFEATGNWWGKAVAESGAAYLLRKDELSDPEDPRRLPLARHSWRSFLRAGRLPEAASTHLWVAVEFAFLDRVDHYLRTTLTALRSYERARPSLPLPHDREKSDRDFAWGLRILLSKMLRIIDSRGADPWWQAALWGIEQATKGRSFQDQRTQHEVWNYLLATDLPLREITAELEDLTRQRDELREKIEQLLFYGQHKELPEKARQRDVVDRDLEEAQRAQRKRLEEVTRRRPTPVELVSVAPATVAKLQAYLKRGEVYLGFLWAGSSIARICIQPDGACSITSPQESRIGLFDRWLMDSKARGDFNVTNPDEDDRDVIAEIARALLGDIPDGVDTLIISPHGPLVGIPWHQFPVPGSADEDDTVGNRYTIGIVPAAGVLIQLRMQQQVAPEATYLGVACNGDGRIPLVDAEVRHIAESYFADDPGTRYLTTQNCGELFETQQSVEILHLACHASRGGLLLSQNGIWTTPVGLLDLRLRANLLLLTGCDAGDFADDDENEFLGVVRQLLVVTHARAAIVSAHPVPDAAGILFSDLLISALTNRNAGRPWQTAGKPLPVGQAVEWARRHLRELDPQFAEQIAQGSDEYIDPADPRWWSQWFVVGDPSAMVNMSEVRELV